MTVMEFAIEVVDQAAGKTDPNAHAELFRCLLALSIAGLQTVEGEKSATEWAYRMGDAMVARKAEGAP